MSKKVIIILSGGGNVKGFQKRRVHGESDCVQKLAGAALNVSGSIYLWRMC